MTGRSPAAKRIVAVALASGIAGLLCLAAACEFLVNDRQTFACDADAAMANLVCPPNQACSDAGRCMPVTNPCTSTNCPAGMMCNTQTLQCTAMTDLDGGLQQHEGGVVEAGQVDGAWTGCHGFGCRCATSNDCDDQASLVCAYQATLTPDIWNALGATFDGGDSDAGYCVEPCCTSSECDTFDGGAAGSGYVCFATGAGGSYCVLPDWLGDRSEIGPNGGGTACGDDAGACRSGLCVSGRCADTCCSSKSTTQCAAGCRFGQFPGDGFDRHFAANCTVPAMVGMGTSGQSCGGDNTVCRSNLCFDEPGFGAQSKCADACRSRDDCPSQSGQRQTCNYIQPNADAGDIVAACVPVNIGQQTGDGGAGDGMPCRITGDCAHGYCAQQPDGRLTCLAVCFSDSTGAPDCPAASPTAEGCRPQPLELGDAAFSVLACGL